MKLLIVDDNKSITDMLAKYLPLKGIEVTVANSGKDGLTMIQNQKYDAILLDLAMPEFSGYDIIYNLEKNGNIKALKIIIFTASSVSKEIIKNLVNKEGIKTCVKKPVPMKELVQVISAQR